MSKNNVMTNNLRSMNLKREGNMHVLTLTDNENENTFTLDVVNEYLAVLDEVESYQGNTALLITCEDPKTWCNGIKLSWFTKLAPDAASDFVKTLEKLLSRLALLNAPTVACLNGNAYAGGAILAAACDFRVMRSDRGRFCLPEVNINIPFTKVMIKVINLISNKHTLKNMALTGIALTGKECCEQNVVDYIYPLETLQQEALKLAAALADKDRSTYKIIKRGMRPDIPVL
ncbi:MAG: enoyl-CoA hydratase/isomerase family protein [Pseudomonadales bacterium]|nr:enoyl-CoA hydratase/isomerase family protein [Pseudomonadales bacterium]